jgi:acylphosphatase
MEAVRAHLIISGLVQGVFYRASARSVANKLGLKGWVKNRYDGKVEAVVEGKRDDVQKFINWCHQGPPGARVTSVEVEWSEAMGEFKDFSIRY